ncbi:MAG: tRNA pseudouridine(55) synthase TruB [Bacteroidia bacterium]|nr:tRNA pseudouridine(55) synthase TruB [Bacteroidia bacterium]
MGAPQWDFASGEVLLFDKPKGWTSFDVVNRVRRLIGGVKVGHAGTLDPLATGLLILCTGAKTKEIDQIQGQDKVYLAAVRLGATTASYDLEQPLENVQDASGVRQEAVLAALAAFRGPILQTPPAHSAIRLGGKRAYELARKGKDVAVAPRPVTVHGLELLEYQVLEDTSVHLLLSVHCSKGTYIRSLAHDLGQALGVGGYLADLCRTQIGPYRLADAWTLEGFAQALSGPDPTA